MPTEKLPISRVSLPLSFHHKALPKQESAYHLALAMVKPMLPFRGRLHHIDSLNVTNQKSKEPVSFYYEALPALSKAGCAAGGCHGAPHGKGEFRLSLWGFDPVSDQHTIINEEFGRRVNLIEPEKSLLLAKPRNDVAHEGGLRLRDSDTEHEVLVNWIKSGCHVEESTPLHWDTTRTGEDLALKRPHHTQQFRVEAMFDDGSLRILPTWRATKVQMKRSVV